jgi:NAD(P)-dependent dehydrogenase (short-subunit alcohol dehydrogenase family)
MPSQAGRHVLITGANRGLGFDMAQALAGAGAVVTMAVRNVAAGQAARERILLQAPRADITVRAVDLENLRHLRAFAAAVVAERPPVDVLIHNAGVILEGLGHTADGFERHIGVNFLAPFVLTLGLLGHMRRDGAARVLGIASLAHTLTRSFTTDDFAFAQGGYAPMEAYARSKLATLLFTAALNRRLAAAGVKVTAVAAHPGYSRTNLDKGSRLVRLATRLISQPTAQGALPLLYAATMPGLAADTYIGPDGVGELRGWPGLAKRSAQARDAALAERLWQAAERATGATFRGSVPSTNRLGG